MITVDLPDGTSIDVDTDDEAVAVAEARKYLASLAKPSTPPQQVDEPLLDRAKRVAESALTSETANDFGRAGGTVARGVMGLPAMAMQAGQEAWNLTAPAQAKFANMLGMENITPDTLRFATENMALTNLYGVTTRGGPPPTGSGIVEGGLGALTGAGLARSAAVAAKSPALKNLAKTMASNPGAQGVAGMSSGAAVEVAKEAGAGPAGQTAAAIVGGLTPAGLGAVGRQAMKTTVQPGYNDVLQRSQEAGLMVPPGYVTRTPGMAIPEGWAGKIKMQQQFSANNAPVIDAIAKKELGLPDHVTLTPEVFESYRATRGRAYEAVKKAFDLPGAQVKLKADDAFKDALTKLTGDYGKASQEFPDLFKSDAIDNLTAAVGKDRFSAEAAVEAVRKLRKDATANMKIYDPEKNAIGAAQKKAANALDDLIERNLTAIGKGDLAKNYRKARIDIAKSHDLESATDPTTGSVSATRLASIGRRRDMTGGMRTIADFGRAFPKAAQDPSKIGTIPTIGNLEALGGLVTSPVVTVAGPVMRGIMGTKGYQQSMVRERAGANAADLGAAGIGSAQGAMMASQNMPSPNVKPLMDVPQLSSIIVNGMSDRDLRIAIQGLPARQQRIAADWLERHGTSEQKAAFSTYSKIRGR